MRRVALKRLMAKSQAKRSPVFEDYEYSKPNYSYTFLVSFREELTDNLLQCSGKEGRELLLRVYLSEFEQFLFRIQRDKELFSWQLHYYPKDAEISFPSAYKKYCEDRIGIYKASMEVLVSQCQLFKIGFLRIINEANYPIDYMEDWPPFKEIAQIDLSYMEPYLPAGLELSLPEWGILHTYLRVPLNKNNGPLIVRKLGYKTSKGLLGAYNDWNSPINMRKGFGSKGKYKKMIQHLRRILTITSGVNRLLSDYIRDDIHELEEKFDLEFPA